MLVVVLAFLFLLLLPMCIFTMMTYLNTRKTAFSGDSTSHEVPNFLVSVLDQVTSNNPEVKVVDGKSTIVRASFADQNISLLPCYHEIYNQIQHFLHEDKSRKDIYVVVDGEPNPIPRDDKVDLVLTTKRDVHPNDIYIPYYVLYANQFHKPLGSLFDASIPHRTTVSNWCSRFFIVFAYSNDNTTRYQGCMDRSVFYQLLLKRVGSRVHNLGRQCNKNRLLSTDKSSKGDDNYQNNDDRYTRYKFVVAFENSQLKGYVSEKMINPLFAGAIPVYLGASDISEHINPECFVNVANYPSFDACIDDLLQLENDIPRVTKMLSAKPLLHDNFLDFLKVKGGNLWPKLQKTVLGKMIPIKRVLPNRIVFATFTYDDMEKAKVVQENMNNSGCFDDIVLLRSENMPYDFVDKHLAFMGRHPERIGLGIWKSMFVKRQLQTLCENDLLVFCELEHQLNTQNKQEWLDLYQQLLADPNRSIVAWKDSFNEKNCTKKSCLEKIGGDKSQDLAQTPHISASRLVLKKNAKTMEFVDKWIELASQYSLLDNTRSPSEDPAFVNHLNDESIFSCLAKSHPEYVQCV